jgi:hypothetical protein
LTFVVFALAGSGRGLGDVELLRLVWLDADMLEAGLDIVGWLIKVGGTTVQFEIQSLLLKKRVVAVYRSTCFARS